MRSVAPTPSASLPLGRLARPVLAFVLALHGLVHWIGFAIPFGLMESTSNTYTTRALWGALDLGDTGARILGLGYLALIIPFFVAAYGIVRRTRWSLPLTAVTAGLSAVICALGSPNAVIGLAMNVVIVALAVLAPRLWPAAARPA